ncbi:hypothetical protein EYF80_032934 [Liparis tanakae]|uniref:Uncharacterized protein n=1 Tax=Liparis tanakae TaxID=230148 RepID=A0A4Z2GT61_9TELE|nr:hypothetical protein EYF80_032934 [Liparis tanakae]
MRINIHVNTSTRRHVDTSTRRQVNTSTRRHVDTSTRRLVDESTRRRVDTSTRRHVNTPFPPVHKEVLSPAADLRPVLRGTKTSGTGADLKNPEHPEGILFILKALLFILKDPAPCDPDQRIKNHRIQTLVIQIKGSRTTGSRPW